MSFDGSGSFIRLYNWVTDRNNGIKINATRMDAEMDGMATGLSSCITRDGQTTLTNNIPFAGQKITGYGSTNAPNSRTDVPSVGQVQDASFSWCGTAGGTADALTMTPSPSIAAYAAGQTFRFIAASSNTSTATVAVSGLSAKAIQRNGAALVANDIRAGLTYTVTYDGTQFQLQSGAAGDYLESSVASGSAVSITSATPANVTSLSLPAGDWDVSGFAQFVGAGTTTVTILSASLSATSATVDGSNDRFSERNYNSQTVLSAAPSANTVTAGPARFSLTTTTTVYLVVNAGFAVSTCSAYGLLRARRIR